MGKVCRNLRYVEENLWQISLLRKEAYIALLIALLVAAFTDTAVLLLLSLEASSTSTIIIDDSDFPGDEFPRNEEIECIPVFLLPFLTAHSTHSDYPNGKITSFRQSNLIDYEILTSLAVPRRHRHQTGSITWIYFGTIVAREKGCHQCPLPYNTNTSCACPDWDGFNASARQTDTYQHKSCRFWNRGLF